MTTIRLPPVSLNSHVKRIESPIVQITNAVMAKTTPVDAAISDWPVPDTK